MENKLVDITVRMYRTGFGDCFLLFFNYKNESKNKHLLIDFGAWKPEEFLQEKGEKFHSLQSIGESIKAVLKGKPIDAVVITHEHKDHLNGFKKAEKSFKNDTDKSGISFSEIWMSWIEDLSNDESKKLKEFKKTSQKVIVKAVSQLNFLGIGGSDGRVRLLNELLSFENGNEPNTENDKNIGQNQSAYEVVKKACDKKPSYYKPGNVIDAWDGVRFYVLGPPTDEFALYTDVSKKDGDLYLSASTLSEDEYSFLNANFNDNVGINKEKWLKNAPFDEEFIITEHRLDYDKGKTITLNDEPTSNEQPTMNNTIYNYLDEANKWRRIDADWLGTAERLAIKLNSHTNNTSLVLAIEMIDADVVLLFPGDAQFGNWKSWGDVKFKIKESDGTNKIIKSEDLLKKAILYKAGHHASHNATAKNEGLEKMKDSLKVTLIPVARKTADGNNWPIPHKALLDRLESFPNHGVIMADFTQKEKTDFLKKMEHHKETITCIFDEQNMFIDIKIANKKNP